MHRLRRQKDGKAGTAETGDRIAEKQQKRSADRKVEEAEERGIKKKTLWNAKKELQIDSVKIGNKWFWMLHEE